MKALQGFFKEDNTGERRNPRSEMIQGRKFANQLKLGDITPLHKKLENIFKENYRPVSLLPVVSKLFERLMQKQMKTFIDNFLSTFLCGYRKGYNTQYALLAMIEKWKKSLDGKGGFAGAILMDLSKAFDTINHFYILCLLNTMALMVPLRNGSNPI